MDFSIAEINLRSLEVGIIVNSQTDFRSSFEKFHRVNNISPVSIESLDLLKVRNGVGEFFSVSIERSSSENLKIELAFVRELNGSNSSVPTPRMKESSGDIFTNAHNIFGSLIVLLIINEETVSGCVSLIYSERKRNVGPGAIETLELREVSLALVDSDMVIVEVGLRVDINVPEFTIRDSDGFNLSSETLGDDEVARVITLTQENSRSSEIDSVIGNRAVRDNGVIDLDGVDNVSPVSSETRDGIEVRDRLREE
jgi:hypothetical protein